MFCPFCGEQLKTKKKGSDKYMNMIVSDASSLIFLSQVAVRLGDELLFKALEARNIVITAFIRTEAIERGLIAGAKDAKLLNIAEERGLIKTLQLNPDLKNKYKGVLDNIGIGGGEAEAIMLYIQTKASALLVDDRGVDNNRDRVEKKLKIELNLIDSPLVFVRMYERDLIDKEKLNKILDYLEALGCDAKRIQRAKKIGEKGVQK